MTQQMLELPGPSERVRIAFVARVAVFRNTLPLIEQQMLDALVSAAIAGHDPGEVARYWISLRIDSTDPADSTEVEAT